MYCPKCGTLNDNENIWCINCGHGKLPTVTPRVDEQNIPVAEPEKENFTVVVEEKFDTENNANEPMPETSEPAFNASVEGKVKSGYDWSVRKKEIKDYFVWAILAAVFCSVTFGIAAIVFSAMTKAEKSVGNTAKAEVYSAKTKLFSIIALIVGIVKYVFAFIMIAVVAAGIFLPFYPYYF